MDSQTDEAITELNTKSLETRTTAKESSQIISWGTTTGKLWLGNMQSERAGETSMVKEDTNDNEGSKGEESSEGNRG
jgi:hypothetical protein